jgi:hypothetical protein
LPGEFLNICFLVHPRAGGVLAISIGAATFVYISIRTLYTAPTLPVAYTPPLAFIFFSNSLA